jgi:pSer/pThr/pTyr-binding forkhead associated (FHA) protein
MMMLSFNRETEAPLDIDESLIGGKGMAKITVRFNDSTVEEVPLTEASTSIGRSKKNDIVINNLAASRRHARIYQEGPRFIVEDLGSLNGTFVNDKRVSQWILSSNDQIQVGKHTLLFIDEDERPMVEPKRPEESKVEDPSVLGTEDQPERLAKIHEPAGEEEPGRIQAGVRIISGGVGQQDVALTKRVTIAGKGNQADIKLKGFLVGKTVFVISQRPPGFFISSSGGKPVTRVNGLPVKDQRELKDGDIISAGRTTIQYYTKP